MTVTAIVLIKAHTDQVTDLAQRLVEVKGVSEVYSVAGRYDLIAIVRVHDNDELATVVSDRIRKIAGIAESETLIAFRTFSRKEIEGTFSIGLD